MKVCHFPTLRRRFLCAKSQKENVYFSLYNPPNSQANLSVQITRNEHFTKQQETEFPGKRLSQTNSEYSPECIEHETAEVYA